MNTVLTVLLIAALYVAACLDYRREQTAARAECPCGCGNPPYRHNTPRSAA